MRVRHGRTVMMAVQAINHRRWARPAAPEQRAACIDPRALLATVVHVLHRSCASPRAERTRRDQADRQSGAGVTTASVRA